MIVPFPLQSSTSKRQVICFISPFLVGFALFKSLVFCVVSCRTFFVCLSYFALLFYMFCFDLQIRRLFTTPSIRVHGTRVSTKSAGSDKKSYHDENVIVNTLLYAQLLYEFISLENIIIPKKRTCTYTYPVCWFFIAARALSANSSSVYPNTRRGK
jgi:hypothetical protein